MEYKFEMIDVALEEGVAVVKLNRPDKLNPMSMKMIEELGTAFRDLRQDEAVKVVVLTGAGRAFSAGGDVDEMRSGKLIMDHVAYRIMSKAFMAIHEIDKPVICALNGIAAGGGAGVALSCDIIFASENAKFSEIFANIGMVPDSANLWNLPRVVGPHKAKELSFTAEIIDAQEMYRLGIAQKLFPPEELMPKAMEFARKLAAGPLLSYKLSKTLIDRGWGMSLEEYFDLEAYAVENAMRSEDFKEGVAAFLEKRKPVYKGK